MTSLNAIARQLFASLRILLLFTLVLGLAYPAAVWGVGQVVARDQANGSLVRDANGRVVGSSLIGQKFTASDWFQGRPSAGGDDGYDAQSSSASNLGPENPDRVRSVKELRAQVAKDNGVPPKSVPPDAVTASGSGLDPHISPAYADLQVHRVATARDMTDAEVRTLVDEHTQGRILGFLGESRVNVLELNLALERAS
ncbi:MAG: potassium-transporting ATPase subunit KdpC [Streptosporangiales bacterium]|nr:potassium-transporting ATPase subunit KdpC [Streptosporangiales bacterium]